MLRHAGWKLKSAEKLPEADFLVCWSVRRIAPITEITHYLSGFFLMSSSGHNARALQDT